MAKFATHMGDSHGDPPTTHMGDPHGDPQTSPQHADPHGLAEKGVITKGGFSPEKSPESLNSLESLENGRILLCFPESGGSLSEGRTWGVGSVVVESAFLGRPDFQSKAPKPLFLKGFAAIWGKNQGAPQTQIQIQQPRIQHPMLGPLISRISKCFKDTPSLKFLVDFVDFFGGFFGPFSLGKQAENHPLKNPPKNPQFSRQLFDQNPLREMSAPKILLILQNLCNPARPLQESPGPSGPGIPKESQKSPKQPRNSLRSLKTVYFETPETVSRLFRTLFGPRGRKAPGDSFETLSGFRARRARETPVRGGRGCKGSNL